LKAGAIEVSGKITALSGVIGGAIIEDGVLKVTSANFEDISADKITGGTIGSSSIELGSDIITNHEVYIVGETPMDVDWLSLSYSGAPLTPEENVTYTIIAEDSSPYQYKKYVWNNSQSTYEEYERKYFKLDRFGNLYIRGGSININDIFEVDSKGHIIAKSGEIGGAVIEDGILKIDDANIKNLSADKLQGGTISASKVELGDTPSFAMNVWIDGTENDYSEFWFKDYLGVTITPEIDLDYVVVSQGDHQWERYIWNGSSYEKITRRYFEVNQDGNVTIHGGSINVDDNFEVDRSGMTRARMVEIEEGYVEKLNVEEMDVKELTTEEIFFGDSNVSLKRISEGSQESHTINVSVFGILASNSLSITINLSENLYFDRTFKVSYTYIDSMGDTYSEVIDILITQGDNSKTVNMSAPGNELLKQPTVFPSKFVETRSLGTNDSLVVMINGAEFDIVTGITKIIESNKIIYLQPGEEAEELEIGDFVYQVIEE
jgi:hypothetical protein